MLTGPLLARLAQLAARSVELEPLLADPKVIADRAVYQKFAKEYGFTSRAAEKHKELTELEKRRSEAEAILAEGADDDMVQLANDELAEIEALEAELEDKVKGLLIRHNEDARRDVIIEIRAGTGGEEAALFAADLFRMYAKYAENRGWKTEIANTHHTELGGLKEITFGVKGENVYSELQHESGGHRVQRVPATESSGRIHTSAVTVAVLPEAEEVDVQLGENDLRIDRFCSTGPGGQSVNTTASAIRLTHIPTGLVVSCQDEKSQHKNLASAKRVLMSRLYERERAAKKRERDAKRKSQIGSGGRSDRIRTYNFPQNRVTDHRLDKNYSLEQIIAGGLGKLLADLREMDREEQLADLDESSGNE
ncbi:MAG: peptide chain release factor 1 [Planctomycetota bacterium]